MLKQYTKLYFAALLYQFGSAPLWIGKSYKTTHFHAENKSVTKSKTSCDAVGFQML